MSVAFGTPLALWALALVAVPVVVHLLARRVDRVVRVPSLRLFHRRATPSLRWWRPSDLGLMALRMAAVVAAALAVAAPLVITPGRLARWNAREARAIVFEPGLVREASDVVSAAARAREGAAVVATFVAPTTSAGVVSGVEWLRTTPPARRTIVVVTSSRRGRVGPADLAEVPPDVGVRIERVEGVEVSDAPMMRRRDGSWQHAGRAGAAPTNAIVWKRIDDGPVRSVVGGAPGLAPTAQGMEGGPIVLALASERERPRAERVLDIAYRDPIVLAPRTVAVTVRFARGVGDEPGPGAHPAAGFTTRAGVPPAAAWRWLRLLLHDPELRQVATIGPAPTGTAAVPRLMLHDATGTACVRVTLASDVTLTIEEDCDDVLAAAVLRAALRTTDSAETRPALTKWDPREVQAWQRDPAPLAAQSIAAAPGASDARWCWAATLVLLVLEQHLRSGRRARRPAPEQGGRAEGAAA